MKPCHPHGLKHKKIYKNIKKEFAVPLSQEYKFLHVFELELHKKACVYGLFTDSYGIFHVDVLDWSDFSTILKTHSVSGFAA